MKDILRDIIINAETIAREAKDLLTDKNYQKILDSEEFALKGIRADIEDLSSALSVIYCRIDEKSEEFRTERETSG